MTYTTTQIREFCDAFDRGELEYRNLRSAWALVTELDDLPYFLYRGKIELRITPKPTPPVYEQWTDIREVPLGDWYKVKDDTIIGRVNCINTDGVYISSYGFVSSAKLFSDFLHSPDPFAPDSEWMICGRVKG